MLRLRPLTGSDEEQALQAHQELLAENFQFLLGLEVGEPWSDYLRRVDDIRRGVNLPVGLVPATFLVAEVERQIVGRVSLRHELNAFLAEVGGHIGYAVRPAFRRRGYATGMLRQSLPIATSLGITRLLVTCDDDNVASATVIERCGGVLENVVTGTTDGVLKRRYWIDLDTAG